jgi:Cys-tRNA(Pro)/Cys-tRNA(Cys) deacylase
MPFRNNVTRLLDARQVPYQVFELPPGNVEGDGKFSADEVAALLGVPADHVYKTLVVVREDRGRKPLLVMAPAGREVSLKKLAASLDEKKKLRMATQSEAEAMTRLKVGGISALALLNRGFEVCLDRAAQALPYIHISAGDRAANLRLSVADLITVTDARLVDTA